MPFLVRKGVSYRITGYVDDATSRRERLYTKLGYIGLAAVVAGTALPGRRGKSPMTATTRRSLEGSERSANHERSSRILFRLYVDSSHTRRWNDDFP